VPRNNNTTSAGGDFGIHTVFDAETGYLHGIVQDSGILVVTGATKVNDTVGREDVLGASGSILGSTSRNKLGVVVVKEVVVDSQVLGGSQDGVVRLEAVLLQKGLITDRLDVEKGIFQAKERVFLDRGHCIPS